METHFKELLSFTITLHKPLQKSGVWMKKYQSEAMIYPAKLRLLMLLNSDGGYILHPAILDACFHPACFPKFHGNFDSNSYFLPAQIGTVSLHQPPEKWYLPSIVYSFLQIIDWNPGNLIIMRSYFHMV